MQIITKYIVIIVLSLAVQLINAQENNSEKIEQLIAQKELVKTQEREQLKKELVKTGEAENESQAGYFMALVSGQLGHKWKDYLRQVIHYKYPNYPWEKDNFSIPAEYKDLVQEIISDNQ